MVQMIRVSMNGPSMATTPSRIGSSVLAAAWAMGAEPWPDSLENSPRLMPQVSMNTKVPPANPPIWAAGSKADLKISARVGGTSAACMISTTEAVVTYVAAMNGTSFEVTRPILRIPPRITAATSDASTRPVTQVGTPRSCRTWSATVNDCTALPEPKDEMTANRAKATASGFQWRPSPRSMEYMGPPAAAPPGRMIRYFMDRVHSVYLRAMPKTAVTHIQNNAPGPP